MKARFFGCLLGLATAFAPTPAAAALWDFTLNLSEGPFAPGVLTGRVVGDLQADGNIVKVSSIVSQNFVPGQHPFLTFPPIYPITRLVDAFETPGEATLSLDGRWNSFIAISDIAYDWQPYADAAVTRVEGENFGLIGVEIYAQTDPVFYDFFDGLGADFYYPASRAYGGGFHYINAASSWSLVPVGATVPEPMTWCMFVTGFGLCGVVQRRRMRTSRA